MANILLIDDNRSFKQGLALNLRRQGFEVITASNGAEGIHLAQDTRPEIILCDIKMPDPDGLAVKRALNSEPETADIPFIFLSAFPASTDQAVVFGTGADDFISKPVDMVDLVARIQAVIERKERLDLYARKEVLNLLQNLSTSLPIHTSHLFRTYLGIAQLTIETARISPQKGEPSLKMAHDSLYRLKGLQDDLIWLNEFDLDRSSTYREQIDLDLAFILPLKELMTSPAT